VLPHLAGGQCGLAALRPERWAMGQVAAAGQWRRLWALGILICAGARSSVTARPLSPSSGRSGPNQGPRGRGIKEAKTRPSKQEEGRGEEIERGCCAGAEWVVWMGRVCE
jgi:hypothetical protein